MTENDFQEIPEWHVAYTLPRMEKKLQSYLEKYGFPAIVPTVRVKNRWKDRWKEIDKPLFNSYIFIHMNYWRDRKKVIVLPGLHHFVFYKGTPAIIPPEDLEMLEIFMTNFPEKLHAKKNELLKPGRFVQIKYGLFAGKTAEILRTSRNLSSVVVRFPAIGQAIQVEIRTEDLGIEEEVLYGE